VAMSRDDPQLLEQIVSGISDGCLASDMALVGGETAIMPDMYQPGDYDLAGFCVGVVERQKVLDGSTISPGDLVIGVASSGLHSNGFSLVRKIVFERAGLKANDPLPGALMAAASDRESSPETPPRTIGEALLRPTTIYARAVRGVLAHYKVKSVVHGIAHITGGGLHENLARVFPPGVGATIDRGSWPTPPVFTWLQELGDVDDDEMHRVFNMGVGLALVVSPYYAESIRQQLATSGVESWIIGRAVVGEQEVGWA
jgi:phosphoribosylformylglycinamidine cyclo-ligase